MNKLKQYSPEVILVSTIGITYCIDPISSIASLKLILDGVIKICGIN